MKVSRAAFLKACCAALLGARVDARALLDAGGTPSHATEPMAAAPAAGRFQWNNANARMFRPHLNTTFAVRSADGTRARIVLTEVAERPITKNVEQFSLIFHAPAGTSVPHGTHAFHHQALGDFDLFVVPIGAPNGRRTVYQACFSRYLSPHEVGSAQATTAPPSRRT